MTQFIYGLLLYIFLMLPPVAALFESMMITHMHMQMPMLVISGFLMSGLLLRRSHLFLEKWNHNGIPGITLFMMIMIYWTIPRTMDEALTMQTMEIWKFISLPFLAGVPLRDSWKKLTKAWKNFIIFIFTVKYFGMGALYIWSEESLCNNYLVIDQLTLGWGFITTAICLVIYLVYAFSVNPSDYE
ncbi:hypothetical protein PZE06_19950 [Robertmurraya sp. DFI.2.37]|uniref:hypothetical protein n=1 Tax=Robertmurraya sp. DFI.2.37 TaxID=3031819 RepID=UPI0012479E41|nr:hypothetical protein [Robertmurraya sp. DFI.2.37]MDF1510410.1 hypothetical protein [Robertmurraya sp. DFI.2.37]